MSKGDFVNNLQEIRKRAREHIQRGAVTGSYKANRGVVIKILNEALATEIVCVLRYKRHFFMAQGIDSTNATQEFAQHAAEEQAHADQIALRITQLGGEPNFSPAGLMDRSHSEYVEGTGLSEMIQEDLVAERIAVESYTDMIAYVGEDDITTRRMLEGILAAEEEHADDMANLLKKMNPLPLKKNDQVVMD
ncbi:MAG TPA: ferritin-like domain-containing protein [bacterium]|nr:ferritin-like domain-containing protein [bacterium]